MYKDVAYYEARGLSVDDHFEVAGTMYRISSLERDDFGRTTIEAYDPNNHITNKIVLYVKNNTRFLVFNQ